MSPEIDLPHADVILFGILTALMIQMAFVAALFVLPSLLLLVTPKDICKPSSSKK